MLSSRVCRPAPRDSRVYSQSPLKAEVFWLLLLMVSSSHFLHGQAQRILCNEGFGGFTTEFPTGVVVKVGASKRSGAFASHTCDAALRWGKQELPVARGSLEVDIDVIGADLGLGTPVVAFQSRDSAKEAGMKYRIYSLQSPPNLLRTLTGGSYYNTQDVKLEDRNEIWTDDAAAIDGFENLPLSSYDFAPTVVLRFEKQRLTDVSSEYQSFFDRQIAQVKAKLDAETLEAFKRSDGKLSSDSPFLLKDLRRLRMAKIKVLEIALSYLYSGRDGEAWNVLSEMWPAADRDRIRLALQDLHGRGMLRQVDGNVKREVRAPWKRRAVVFDMVTVTHKSMDGMRNVMSMGENTPTFSEARVGVQTQTTVDVAPVPIYLGLTVAKGAGYAVPGQNVYLNLVIDAAGKVRSAQAESRAENNSANVAEIEASASWSFIPAFKSGHPAACRMRMAVSPQQ